MLVVWHHNKAAKDLISWKVGRKRVQRESQEGRNSALGALQVNGPADGSRPPGCQLSGVI